MDPRPLAQLIAAGRLAIGGVLVAKPELITKHWVGPAEGGRLGTRTMAEGLGIRDVALGGGVLAALHRGEARHWVLASAVADLGDLVATIRSRDELPKISVLGTIALAGGSAALGAWLATQPELG